jgi:DNA polymerase-3 subunit alpha
MKNFCSYFLIVWDFCNFARENGIPVGARGSGVGTMVGYLLGLCNVDPIKYGLLFERFMDPSRNEMPDIDIDICQDGRQKVIKYVRNKYGHVAQIITFGTLAAKAACKDVGRVLGVPLPEVDKLTKLIPGTPGMTLDKAMKLVPELLDLYNQDPKIREVIDLAKKLEGLCRNAGVHAAGVIIADQELDQIIPLCKDKDGNLLTQFEGPVAEKCGLLKMDFLGLRTLTTLQRSIDLVKQTKGKTIDIEHIDFTNRRVLDLFCRGETKGIFQFESGGMQDLLMKMEPDRIEDLIAANALYRPGPMELIPLYCNRKHGRERVPEVHPIMDKILAETYGIMVYQEQVMQIFNQLGGIELSNAYKLIKAISKKTVEVIAKFKPDFIKGTMEKGVSKEKAEEIFDLILKFGGYGFNKSHSTRYAIVAFQTAYMKTYHPIEYMAALLTFEMGSTDKVVEYIEECRKMGLRVLPPDVNVSDTDFTPVYGEPASAGGSGTIRFGLCAVKGVGEKAVEGVIEERKKAGPFRSIYDFCERVDTRAVQRSTIEALIKCGAFETGQQNQNDRRSGQGLMFMSADESTAPRTMNSGLPEIDELPSQDLLKFEKDLLGFYITSHPLTEHQTTLERYSTATTREALQLSEGVEVTIGGMISRLKKVITKNGRSAGMPMAIITLEDLEGQIDGTMFAETYADILKKYPGAVEVERIVFVRGKIDRKRETPSVLINEVLPIADALPKLTTTVALKLDGTRHNSEQLREMKSRLKNHKGNLPIFAQIETLDGRKVVMKFPKDLNVRPTPALIDDLDQLLGAGTVQLYGDGQRRLKRLQQQALFKESEQPTVEASAQPTDEQVSQQMDEEEMLQEA